MMLATQQQSFMAQILTEGQALPPHWDARMAAGLAIYRNAYRSRLVEALRETFPRTVKWVGDEAFAQAGAHHLIAHPPSGWTLDLVGLGFAATLAELFREDPEVPELAWLEWAMHVAFTAADRQPLDAQGFTAATAGFSEVDWASLRVATIPGLCWNPVSSDCVSLWQDLGGDDATAAIHRLDGPLTCVVWRAGHQPVCELWPEAEAMTLSSFASGKTFGQVCEGLTERWPQDAALAMAGAGLSRLITSGMIEAVNPS